MGVVFGLLTSLSIGTSDLFGRRLANARGPIVTGALLQLVALLTSLMSRIRLTNGRFFLDSENRPGGWQDLEISDLTGFFADLNAVICLGLLEDDDLYEEVTPQTRKRILQAAEKGFEWVSWDEAGLHFTLPLEPADKRALKEHLLRGYGEEDEDDIHRGTPHM